MGMWSANRLAAHCGVDERTVRNIRSAFEELRKIRSSPGDAEPPKLIGKDGKAHRQTDPLPRDRTILRHRVPPRRRCARDCRRGESRPGVYLRVAGGDGGVESCRFPIEGAITGR